MKNKIIRVDCGAWNRVRQMFPNSSDATRSRIISNVLDIDDVKNKLTPEFSDTKKDKIIKKMLKGML